VITFLNLPKSVNVKFMQKANDENEF
jgi:hypothetical protein